MQISFPSVDARTLLDSKPQHVVDLRSPGEFADDHVPGAVNVPLFDDVQRALVGTLYVQSSPEAAFGAARDIVRESIRGLVERISAVTGWAPNADDFESRADAMTGAGFASTSSFLVGAVERPAPDRAVVFHCWRGGLRSRSVLHFVRELGFADAALLSGGYKGYRGEILRRLTAFEPPPTFVLRGLTGVGKTLVLREIEKIAPELVLDLEALAGHRGSLLGMVGLQPCSQRTFDSRISDRLRGPLASKLVVEGESRKVGDVIVPPKLWHAMEAGVNIELTASIERRIEVLEADYLSGASSLDALRRQLPLIEQRMSKKHVGPGLVALLDAGRTSDLVRLLLEHYYDPLYRHSQKGKRNTASIDATDPRSAAERIVDDFVNGPGLRVDG